MIYFLLALLLPLSISVEASDAGFDKVVIWGHKLHTHTHSYIHYAFYKAFKAKGYETYWFDDQDCVDEFDFSRSLFLTEGQVDKNIPLRGDCMYILHNCDSPKYRETIEKRNRFALQVYTDSVLKEKSAIKMAPCIYEDSINHCLYMPWASDLLPEEIEENKKIAYFLPSEKCSYWIGTIGEGYYGNIEEIAPFKRACSEEDVMFIHKMPGTVNAEDSIRLIQESYIAPAVVGTWQKEVGYIPCRIFKNISYGKMGVTNSYRVYELFEKKIIYNDDPYQLLFDAKEILSSQSPEKVVDLMDFVKEKHTYLNRVDTLLNFFKRIRE